MKTAEEKQFDNLLDEYFDKFGKNYPLDITDTMTTKEHIKRIKTALKSDKEVNEMRYQPDVTY